MNPHLHSVIFSLGNSQKFYSIAKFLCLFQGRSKIQSLVSHPGQNIIGSTVKDGADGRDSVRCQVLLESRDEWYAAPNTCLIADIGIVPSSEGEQLVSMFSHYLLVGCNYVLSASDGSFHIFRCWMLASDEFDYYVYPGMR